LNQDFQDFEDFLVLGVGWSFESGFSGFLGFFSVGRWYWDDACRSSKCKINYPPFLFADAMIAAARYLARNTFPITTILNQRRYH
jgi:hypothetical protein